MKIGLDVHAAKRDRESWPCIPKSNTWLSKRPASVEGVSEVLICYPLRVFDITRYDTDG